MSEHETHPVGTADSVVRKLRAVGVEVLVSSVIPRTVASEVLDLFAKAEAALLPEQDQ